MFPAVAAAPFAGNVVCCGILAISASVYKVCYVLLSFLAVHGIRDTPLWEMGCWVPEAQRRTTAVPGSARGLPRMPVRFVPAHHYI